MDNGVSKLGIKSDDTDRVVRERCFLYSLHRWGDGNLGCLIKESEDIYNYIWSGVIPKSAKD